MYRPWNFSRLSGTERKQDNKYVFSEYRYEDELEATKQEAFKTDVEKGEENGIILAEKILWAINQNPHLTNRQVTKNVGCAIETVKRLRKSYYLLKESQ